MDRMDLFFMFAITVLLAIIVFCLVMAAIGSSC